MRVRATALGYYDMKRRRPAELGRNDAVLRPADEFELAKPEHFSHAWMEPMDEAAKKAQAAKPKRKGLQTPYVPKTVPAPQSEGEKEEAGSDSDEPTGDQDVL